MEQYLDTSLIKEGYSLIKNNSKLIGAIPSHMRANRVWGVGRVTWS